MIAARNPNDLETLDRESPNHRVINPEKPRTPRPWSPRALNRSTFPLRRLDRAIRKPAEIPLIERPMRSRVVVSHDEPRVTRVRVEEPVEIARLSPANQDGRKRPDRMRCMKVDVDEVDRAFEAGPIRRLQDDAPCVAEMHRDPFVGSWMTKCDSHALKGGVGFEAAVREFARNRLGVLMTQLLGSEHIDLVFANEIDEPVRIGPPPPEISR